VVGDAGVHGLPAVSVLERGLGAVLHPELREQVLDVELDRVVRQAEAFGDLRVGEAARDQSPHLALSRREIAGRAGCPPPALDPASRPLVTGGGS